jgi:hypothetical protein
MARSFSPNRGDRGYTHDLAGADDMPDLVTVDLDDKDPNAIEVVEVDDTPEADRGKPTNAGESTADQEDDLRERVSTRTKRRIDRLKFESHTERRNRETAERERDEALRVAADARAEVEDLRRRNQSSTSMVATAMISRNETEMSQAKAKFAKAQEDGDGTAMADANADIARLAAEHLAIKARTPRQPDPNQPQERQQERQPEQRQQPQQSNLAPNVERWMGRNTWFQKPGSEAKTSEAMSIHYKLIAEGVQPTSESYTRELDKRLKAVYPDHEPIDFSPDDGDVREGRSTPRRTNAVAPGSRESGAANRGSGGPRTVELTRTELSIAKRLGVTPQAYAVEKLKREQKTGGAQ